MNRCLFAILTGLLWASCQDNPTGKVPASNMFDSLNRNACNKIAANAIDSLKTKEDIQKFLEERVNPGWAEWGAFEHVWNPLAHDFVKIDLDQNKLTDLIINGKYLFVVADSGNGKYATCFISQYPELYKKRTLKNIFYTDKTCLLEIENSPSYTTEEKDTTKTDTLALVYGGLYEYNPLPDDLKIDEIKLTTSHCYGTCPVFQLNIRSDRNATFNAIEYNDQKGQFKTSIDTTAYNNLVRTINYIRLTSLKDRYSVRITDGQTVTLEIKFNNGQTKKISDYWSSGPYGLENLFAQLFALRNSQRWKKIML